MKLSSTEDRKFKRISQKLGRFMLKAFGVFILLVAAMVLILKTSPVQQFIKDRVLQNINKVYQQDISIQSFYLNPFTGFEASLLIRDHHQDTLVYSNKLQVGLMRSLWSLYSRSLHLEDIKMDSSVIKWIQYENESKSNMEVFISKFRKTDSTASKSFSFNLKNAYLGSSTLLIRTRQMNTHLGFDRFQISIDSINLPLRYFAIRKVILDRPICSVIKNNLDSLVARGPVESDPKDSCNIGYGIWVQFININNGSFFYPYSSGQHDIPLDWIGLNCAASNLFVSLDLKQLEFLHLNSKTNRDFHIRNLKLNHFLLAPHKMSLQALLLETGRSTFELKTENSWTGPLQLDNLKSSGMINLEIAKGILHPMDVHALMSNSNWMHDISWSKDQAISLSGHIFGKTTSLKGKKIHFNYANQLHFDGDISARNLFEPEQALINLRVLLLSTNAAFIRKTFPKLHIPAQYDRFGRIQMNGQFDGYFKNFVAFGTFRTELGEIRTDVKFRFDKSIRNAEYSGKVLAEGLNLGNLLQEEDFGKLSFAAEVYNGKGLTQENLAASLKGEIRSFEYKKYRYQNILVSGVFNKDQFQGSVASQDPNASFNLSGIIQREQSHWNVDLQTKVQHLDLLRLNLSQDSITFGGSISGKFSGSTEDDLSGYIRVQDAKLRLRHNDFEMASINLEQDIIRNNRRLRLQSDFVDFGLEGKFRIRELKDVMLQHLEKRHPTLSSTFNLISKKKVSASAFNGYLTVKKGPKLALLLGTPLIVHNADLDIQFDSKNDFLEIKSNRFDAAFQRLSLGKFSFNVTSGDNLFIVSTADYIDSGGKKLGGNFKFTSRIQGHSGQTGIQIFDSTNTRILVNVNSQMSSQEQKLIISLLNKDLFFNNKRWLIAPTNLMSIGKNQLIIRDFELTDSIYYLSIRDVNEKGIAVKTDGFDISFVNAFIKNKSISFSGLFNSDLIIPDLKSLSGVSGSINVFQLHFNKDNYGPFSVRFSADDFTKPWNLKLENAFQEHVLRGEGSINIPSKRAVYSGNAFDFNLNLDARAFPLAFLENFIASISKTHGGCDGKINFFREDGGFYLTGNLKTREGGTHINYLGIPVQFKDQPIQLQKDRIVFDDLTIGDKLGNPISVDGTLYHTQLKNYHSDIRIRSPKALMLDTEKSENSYYYGYGIGSFDVTFKGPFSMLDMDVKATSQKGTKISIPVQSQQSAAESGFVRFNSPAKSNELVGVSSPSPISGLNLNMQLTMTEEAEVAIIFDELAGDILRGNGRGNMVIKSLRNGLFTINGNFEVEQGQYLFTLYNFVNKPFTIRRGGTINWTGDPLDADINLEATYEGLYAAPYPLIQEYPLNDDQNLTEEAKRRTDVELTMKLSGSLLKPDIHFDIEMPDLTGLLKNYSDNKLTFLRSNQDQMNQQVFGLLVLRTFLSSANPFEGGVFGNIQATTINTMSEMLSNQFSLFVSSLLSNAFDDVDFISGVDFNIGYDLDNATIGGTKLNEGEVVFSLRHRLWNEQLIVTLGGNYKSNSSIYGNSYFNPESVIEWNTPVEGLKLRIYYRGDESIEGLKHKVGTGVSYRREFDSFFDFEKAVKSQNKTIKDSRNAPDKVQ